MTTLSQIGHQIQEALATFLRRDPSTVEPEHNLREDLGLDSLMTFELLYELEKAFDLEIPNEDLPGLQTLGDLIAYVEGRLHSSGSPVQAASTSLRPKKKSRQFKAATSATKKERGKSKPIVKAKKGGSGSITKKRTGLAKAKRKKS